jgi:flagellin
MTRINTNVSSIIAQGRLRTNTGDLQTRLERLATGLRINRGKDDPAGLIASEILRSEISAIGQAIDNSQTGHQRPSRRPRARSTRRRGCCSTCVR